MSNNGSKIATTRLWEGYQPREQRGSTPSTPPVTPRPPRGGTAIIEREDDAYVSLCPELDIASQGDTVEAARANLVEALELFFESADASELTRRLHGEVFITRIDVQVPVG